MPCSASVDHGEVVWRSCCRVPCCWSPVCGSGGNCGNHGAGFLSTPVSECDLALGWQPAATHRAPGRPAHPGAERSDGRHPQPYAPPCPSTADSAAAPGARDHSSSDLLEVADRFARSPTIIREQLRSYLLAIHGADDGREDVSLLMVLTILDDPAPPCDGGTTTDSRA